MRWISVSMVAAVSIFGALAVGQMMGCANDRNDCTKNPLLACFTSGAGGSSGSGGAGGTGGTPNECVPNQAGDQPIDGVCGVFVAAAKGADTNAGTREKPLATLKKAVEVAKGKAIYACADPAKPFDEALEVSGDANVFGGLDCLTWKYVPQAKTKWTAGADEVPLTAAVGGSVTLQDVTIEATDATKDGGSSIAIVAQANATVDLVRCEVAAGNGKDGATPAAPAGAGTPGMAGDTGLDGCVDMMGKLGGNGGALTCDGTDVSGGPGGSGLSAATGGAGSPGLPVSATTGIGGLGQGVAMSCDVDGNGGDGADGLLGDPGAGATSKGSLSATGYKGEDGKDGAGAGKPGQGGGGGGGAQKCGANAGPSASGGGSGGCGGAVGKGGQAGGASIAIVSAGAKLVLSDVKITAKNGGRGGDGGPGQAGGDGGAGGVPGMGDANSIACAGGKGGKGGAGGRGGGGLGGHSIAIAHTDTAPKITGATLTISAAGQGGIGDGATGNGAAGIAKEVQAF